MEQITRIDSDVLLAVGGAAVAQTPGMGGGPSFWQPGVHRGWTQSMLIATTVFLLGLLAGIGAVQLFGLRLGGVIIVPLVAVYLLRSFATFPVFVLSTLAAYLSLSYTKRRLPIYGRQLFLLAIVVGALVPLTVVELLSLGLGVERTLSEVEFIGSVLPGVAAYNFHRLEPERRSLGPEDIS